MLASTSTFKRSCAEHSAQPWSATTTQGIHTGTGSTKAFQSDHGDKESATERNYTKWRQVLLLFINTLKQSKQAENYHWN